MDRDGVVITVADFPFHPGTKFIKEVKDHPGCFDLILIIGPADSLEPGWTSIVSGGGFATIRIGDLLRLVANGDYQLIPPSQQASLHPVC